MAVVRGLCAGSQRRTLTRSSCFLALVVIGVAIADWVGWATGSRRLTQIFSSWPAMTPWTAALLATMAVSLLLQAARRSVTAVRVGRSLALAVGALTVIFLAEYLTGRSFGLDTTWFSESVRSRQSSYPGRPSPQTASSVVLLSLAVTLQRIDRRWTPLAWMAGLTATLVTPFVAVVAYVTATLSLVGITRSTGMGMSTAWSLILLVAAACLARPDRNPVAWLLARPDRRILVRTAGFLAGLPIIVGVARQAFLAAGLHDDAAWVLAVSAGSAVVGAATFYIGQRADRTLLASERQYRLIAENSGDVVCHIRDDQFAWISPSAEQVLGAPAEHWLGRAVRDIVPPGGFSAYTAASDQVNSGSEIKDRARVISLDGSTHWVHVYAKPFYNSDGRQDGVTASLRVVDDEVAAEQAAERARDLQALADLRYRRLMETSGVAMALATTDGRFEVINPSMCDFFGYDAETLRGKSVQALTAAEYLDTGLDKIDDLCAGRIDSYRVTQKYVNASGHPVWGDVSTSCLRGLDGRPESVVIQIIDITAEVLLAKRLREQTDRLTSQLNSAAAYISAILPGDINGAVRISSRYLPSEGLAGDCFDYRWLDDDHLIVYVIDVSGHGVQPALVSISAHNMLRSGSMPTGILLDPEKVLIELNRRFQMERQGGNYFTMWYGVYTRSSRTLHYASAGHPPALLFTAGREQVTELSTTGLPVGMFDDADFPSATTILSPGSQLLLYTDGVYEVPLGEGQEWSREDFVTMCTRAEEWSLDTLIDQLRSVTAAGTFNDDCSLISMLMV